MISETHCISFTDTYDGDLIFLSQVDAADCWNRKLQVRFVLMMKLSCHEKYGSAAVRATATLSPDCHRLF